jgi:hypothetical protein
LCSNVQLQEHDLEELSDFIMPMFSDLARQGPCVLRLVSFVLKVMGSIFEDFLTQDFDFAGFYENLASEEIGTESKCLILDLIRTVLAIGIDRACIELDLQLLRDLIQHGGKEIRLASLKVLVKLVHESHRGAEVIDFEFLPLLVNLVENGTFPIRRSGFKILARLMETLPDVVVPLLFDMRYLELLLEFLESATGDLMKVVLTNFVFLLLGRVYMDEIVHFFLENNVEQKILELTGSETEEIASLKAEFFCFFRMELEQRARNSLELGFS